MSYVTPLPSEAIIACQAISVYSCSHCNCCSFCCGFSLMMLQPYKQVVKPSNNKTKNLFLISPPSFIYSIILFSFREITDYISLTKYFEVSPNTFMIHISLLILLILPVLFVSTLPLFSTLLLP